MPIPQSQQNRKMDPADARSAFATMNWTGLADVVRKRPGAPDIPSGDRLTEHLQGIAVLNGQLIISSSTRPGYLFGAIPATAAPGWEVARRASAGGYDHPGGIQAIGDHLAVPVYGGSGTPEVQIRRASGNFPVVNRIATGKPYCVGITDVVVNGDHFFVLAVSVSSSGKTVHIYHSTPGQPLGSPSCDFVLKQKLVSRSPINVNRDFMGYPNSISLYADTAGGVYFVGLYNANFDYADLFEVDLTVEKGKQMMNKLAHRKANRPNAAGFRWGASARVVDGQTLMLAACARKVRNGSEIEISRFTR